MTPRTPMGIPDHDISRPTFGGRPATEKATDRMGWTSERVAQPPLPAHSKPRSPGAVH
jgi:hypothetical protein